MTWMHNYQLILFDFDGLLVNTEEIHYRAYKEMCANRGVELTWDFPRYCQAAHYEAHAMRVQLYDAYPQLYLQEPSWDVLYAEKKALLLKFLGEGMVQLMPGANELLKTLAQLGVPRCVVTNSSLESVKLIQQQHPILESIPYWVTREDYTKQKPDPEGYLKAIALYSKPGQKIIGFEDTPRGIKALQGTPAQPVLICNASYPEIPQFLKQNVFHISSLMELNNIH